jgi:hypothetical protein
LLDTWRNATPGDHGFTWNRRNPHVAATFEPSARIDYVFIGPPGAAGQGHVVSAGLPRRERDAYAPPLFFTRSGVSSRAGAFAFGVSSRWVARQNSRLDAAPTASCPARF